MHIAAQAPLLHGAVGLFLGGLLGDFLHLVPCPGFVLHHLIGVTQVLLLKDALIEEPDGAGGVQRHVAEGILLAVDVGVFPGCLAIPAVLKVDAGFLHGGVQVGKGAGLVPLHEVVLLGDHDMPGGGAGGDAAGHDVPVGAAALLLHDFDVVFGFQFLDAGVAAYQGGILAIGVDHAISGRGNDGDGLAPKAQRRLELIGFAIARGHGRFGRVRSGFGLLRAAAGQGKRRHQRRQGKGGQSGDFHC